MPNKYDLLVGGKWKETRDKLDVINPYNGELVAKVCMANESDFGEAITKAFSVFETMKNLPAYKRADILKTISSGIEKRGEEISRIISLEAGKPIRDAEIEVSRAVGTFRIASEEAMRFGGEIIPIDVVAGAEKRIGLVKRFPIGPVMGITPFNFPLNLVSHKVAPALAVGNPIIIKPASKTPITSLILGEISIESGLPEGAISVLPSKSSIAEKMLLDERIKKLTFTGSAEVGWHLKSLIPKKKVTLELGGNAALIIHEDVNLDYAINRAVTGSFSFAGQICISIQRIYVHENIYNDFIKGFLEKTLTLKLGDPIDRTTDIGPMVDLPSAIRTEEWIEKAINGGAKVLTGGKRNGQMFEPTVLTDVKWDMEVCCKEVFAPVVCIWQYTDFNQAINEVNNSRYGLQAGLFTNDVKRIFKAYEEIEVGGLIINDIPTYRVDPMPYGGVKESGFGREGLKYAMEEMTELRLMVLNLL